MLFFSIIGTLLYIFFTVSTALRVPLFPENVNYTRGFMSKNRGVICKLPRILANTLPASLRPMPCHPCSAFCLGKRKPMEFPSFLVMDETLNSFFLSSFIVSLVRLLPIGTIVLYRAHMTPDFLTDAFCEQICKDLTSFVCGMQAVIGHPGCLRRIGIWIHLG